MHNKNEFSDNEWALIGNRIRTRRKELGIKQIDLAERIDVSVTHMSAIERGVQHPSLYKIVRISEELNTTPDFFLLGTVRTRNIQRNIIERLLTCDESIVDLAIKLIFVLDDEYKSKK